jgi:hypothetical protein
MLSFAGGLPRPRCDLPPDSILNLPDVSSGHDYIWYRTSMSTYVSDLFNHTYP